MSLSVGDRAPTFELDGIDESGNLGRFGLGAGPGAPVLLVFYPADSSPVCRRQLSAYTEGAERFAEVGVSLLALSPQDVESHRRFAQERGGFAFPLLSDTDKAVARSYGNLGLLDLYRRSTILVDGAGSVAYVHRYFGLGLGFRPVDDLIRMISDGVGHAEET